MKNKNAKVETNSRKALFCSLEGFEPQPEKGAFIEVTEWTNGEGFDLFINCYGIQMFQLTWGQWDAVKHLIKRLNKQ